MKLRTFKIEKIINNEKVYFFPTLVLCENSTYLIDCGYEETVAELITELHALGVEIQDLTGVIISHDDHDHLGGLYELKSKNKALKVFCGKIEEESISGKIKSERLLQAENLLTTTADEYKDWALNFIEMLTNVRRVSVDECFEDNQTFEQELVIIYTPGHTKGHISFYYPKEKTLIAGDAIVIEDDKLNIANPSFTLNMQMAIRSVEKIRKLAPEKIICYHGGIMEDQIDEKLKALINEYKSHL